MAEDNVVEQFPDGQTGVQSRFVIVHQLRTSADIQDRETKARTGWADTNDRATLMRRAADVIERLAAQAHEPSADVVERDLSEMDWPDGGRFTFHDDPGEHDPCYVVMPGGASVPLCHHARNGVDQARAKFIVEACNAALDAPEPSDDACRVVARAGAAWGASMSEDEGDRAAAMIVQAYGDQCAAAIAAMRPESGDHDLATAAYLSGSYDGRKKEKAGIVAWLRAQATASTVGRQIPLSSGQCHSVATAIERGADRKGNGDAE